MVAAAGPTLAMESELLAGGAATVVGVDEVGRGALAGPVTVGAVMIDQHVGAPPAGVRDSKKLTAAARQRLYAPLAKWATSWAIGHAWPAEIDHYGISVALHIAAWRALQQLNAYPHTAIVDGTVDFLSRDYRVGMTLPDGVYEPVKPNSMSAAPIAPGDVIPTISVVTRARADQHCATVAAAAILAKVTRDDYVTRLADDFPHYGFAAHKGYGTKAHMAALEKYGPCPVHRRSWKLPGAIAGAI